MSDTIGEESIYIAKLARLEGGYKKAVLEDWIKR